MYVRLFLTLKKHIRVNFVPDSLSLANTKFVCVKPNIICYQPAKRFETFNNPRCYYLLPECHYER